MTAEEVKKTLLIHASRERAAVSARFFKTGPGQYGEDDKFIGVSMPDIRKVCKRYRDLPLADVQELLVSPVHEHRMAGAIILANTYPKASPNNKQKIYDLYLKNVYGGRINNWDLVDVTTPNIIGEYLVDRPKHVLYELANSKDIWQKRVAVLATFAFIKRGEATDTLKIAEILLQDAHDLIQKAVGWMLREVGKRVDQKLLLEFLDQHAHNMPRTALRYAIEHLTPKQKAHYMSLKNL